MKTFFLIVLGALLLMRSTDDNNTKTEYAAEVSANADWHVRVVCYV